MGKLLQFETDEVAARKIYSEVKARLSAQLDELMISKSR